MKNNIKILAFIIVSFLSINVNAQESIIVEPLINTTLMANPKPGILADKTLSDGNRVIYCNTVKPWIKNVDGDNTIINVHFDPIAVKLKDGDEIKFGFSFKCTLKQTVAVKTGGRALIKTSNGTNYNAQILYGCPNESHATSNVSTNLMSGAPITTNSKGSSVFAHVIVDETTFMKLLDDEIVKIRVESETGQTDIEMKGGKLQKHMAKCYPILKETIQKESTGFDNGF